MEITKKQKKLIFHAIRLAIDYEEGFRDANTPSLACHDGKDLKKTRKNSQCLIDKFKKLHNELVKDGG